MAEKADERESIGCNFCVEVSPVDVFRMRIQGGPVLTGKERIREEQR